MCKKTNLSSFFCAIVDDCEILAVPPSSSKREDARKKNKQSKTTIDVVTVQDPITGEPVKQLVQTVTDATTGKIVQIPLPANVQADNLDEGWILLAYHTTYHLLVPYCSFFHRFFSRYTLQVQLKLSLCQTL